MTRPIGGKPESTQDKYSDVHSVGSSFGAELDEKAVRNLLGGQVESPFASIVVGLAETVTDILDSVARGIVGLFVPGAKEGAIRNAIIAVMEPLESQVYDLGLNLTALSDETKILIGEQSGLVDEANAALEIVKTTLAEQAAKNEEFQSELATAREETSEAIAKSSEAVSLANSINAALTKQITSAFNEAIAKAEEGISKAESANADLINLNTNLGEITEQASELNNQLSAQNEKFTNGLANANTAIGEAKDAAAAVKKIADQNKKDVASAIAKADAANADLATLTPKVTDAVAKANKASSDVSTLTPKVTSASAEAAKASQDVAALSPKVTDAVNKSAKATSDVAALTPKVTAAQSRADSAFAEAGKVRSEVTPKIEAAQTKGETALAAADKAIADSEFVAGFADDLIPKDENGKSTWNQGMASIDVSPEGSAFGSERTALMEDSFTFPVAFNPVKGQEVYRLTVWIYRDPDSRSGGFSFHVVDEDGQRRWVEARLNLGEWRPLADRTNLFTTVNFDTWEKHVLDFRWPEHLGPARIRFQLNNGNAFYIHDPQVRVIQPLDNSVDQAQNDAIRANTEILRQQQEINAQQEVFNTFQTQFNEDQVVWNQASSDATQALQEVAKAQEDINAEQTKFNNFQTEFNEKQTAWNEAVDRSLETQDTVNENFEKWTEGATTAIEANSTAIKALNAPQIGSSILPLIPGTEIPVWQYHLSKVDKSQSNSATDNLPEGVTHIYRSPEGKIPAGGTSEVKIPNSNVVMIDPAVEYEASWWTYSTSGDARYIFVTLEDENGSQRIVQKTGDSEASQYTFGNPTRAIITPATPTWTKYTTRFKFKEGTQFVRFSNILFSNATNTDDSYLYIADLHIGPKIPTQAQVDDAQNKAIQANADLLVEQARINVEQERINTLRTEFEEEQQKINAAQADINTLNTETGKANQAATEALSKVLGINIGGRNLLVNSYLNKTSNEYLHSRIPLGDSRPETGETVTVSLKATPGEGNTRFRFFNSRGNGTDMLFDLFINENPPTAEGVYTITGTWKKSSTNSHLNVYAYPSGADTDTTIEWVKLERGNTATDWTPAPEETPSQADLNQNFQDNFERIDGELGLIKSTDQVWKDSQTKVTESLTKATEANTQALTTQKNLNNLFQEQLWAQLDMIEQLELQSPRVYHQNVDDGKLISNIPSWVGWNTAREYKNTFINFYHRNSDTKQIAWQATGRWEGQVRVTMNWSNGATDVWVYTIHKDRITRGDSSWSGRTFFNSGGASLIYHRNTTFEVYPKHLGRWFNLFWKPEDSSWYHSTTALDIRGVEGGPSILRWDTANAKENPGIRLTTSFSCNQPLTLTDMTGKEVTYPAGTTINPQVVDVSKLDKTKQYRFEEVGVHW